MVLGFPLMAVMAQMAMNMAVGYGLCVSILMKETTTTHKQQPIVIAKAMTNKPEPQKWSYMVPYSYKGVYTVLGDHKGPLYGPVWSCNSWVKFQL